MYGTAENGDCYDSTYDGEVMRCSSDPQDLIYRIFGYSQPPCSIGICTAY